MQVFFCLKLKNVFLLDFINFIYIINYYRMEDKKLSEDHQSHDFMILSPEIRKQRAEILLKVYKSQSQLNFVLQPNGDKAQIERHSSENEAQSSSKREKPGKKEIEKEHIMTLLRQMIYGKKTCQIYKDNKQLKQYPLAKLRNCSTSILKKIAKTLIKLLPNDNKMKYNQFYHTFFKQKEVLSQYLPNNCNLVPIVEKLLYISQWQKNNKQYLEKGYANDYLPSEILDIIKSIPSIYSSITECYYTFSTNLKKHRKIVTPTSTTQRSIFANSENNEINQRINFQSSSQSCNF